MAEPRKINIGKSPAKKVPRAIPASLSREQDTNGGIYFKVMEYAASNDIYRLKSKNGLVIYAMPQGAVKKPFFQLSNDWFIFVRYIGGPTLKTRKDSIAPGEDIRAERWSLSPGANLTLYFEA